MKQRFLSLFLTYALWSCNHQNVTYEMAVITNEDDQSISFFDLNRQEQILNLEVGKRPRGIKYAPKRNMIYVALSGSPKCPPWVDKAICKGKKTDKTADGIAEIDANTKQISRIIKVGSDPEQFDISKDETHLYVANEDDASLSIVNIDTGQIILKLPVGEEPEGVRVSPDNNWVIVTCEEKGEIVIIDRKKNEILKTITIGGRPRELIFTQDSKTAYISNEYNQNITKLNLTTMKTEAVYSISGLLPVTVLLSKNEKHLYVAGGRGKMVAELNLSTGKVSRSVEVKDRPWGLAINQAKTILVSANGGSNDISLIDIHSFKTISKINSGKSPWGAVIIPIYQK